MSRHVPVHVSVYPCGGIGCDVDCGCGTMILSRVWELRGNGAGHTSGPYISLTDTWLNIDTCSNEGVTQKLPVVDAKTLVSASRAGGRLQVCRMYSQPVHSMQIKVLTSHRIPAPCEWGEVRKSLALPMLLSTPKESTLSAWFCLLCEGTSGPCTRCPVLPKHHHQCPLAACVFRWITSIL